MERIEIKGEPILHQPENIEHEVLFESPLNWIKIRNCTGFHYAERKGVDSVAFVLFDINTDDNARYGFVKEFKSPLNRFLVSAFGGSIDKPEYKSDLRILVKEEVMEEAGFDVSLEDIAYYGKRMVSTQMNQFCYLFGVTVNKKFQKERTTTNFRELDSTVVWHPLPNVLLMEDWKATLIVTLRMAASNAKLTVRPIQSSATPPSSTTEAVVDQP